MSARFHIADMRAAGQTVTAGAPGESPTGAMLCRDCLAGYAVWVAENQIGRLTAGRDPVAELAGIVMFGVELGLALAHQDGIDPGQGLSQLALRLGRYIIECGDQRGRLPHSGVIIGVTPCQDGWRASATTAADTERGTGDTFTDALRALLDEAGA